jgi:biopolymer transport protein ExbD
MIKGEKELFLLFNSLIKKKEEIKNIARMESSAKTFSGLANLVIDKSIKYDYVKKVMYTCAEAGFKEFKFVVMGEE